MSLIESIRKYIFGYDVFISYSRKDGLDYAYQLAEQLMNKGYECFIDQVRSFVPGKELPQGIIHSLQRSTALVIVGSEGSQTSASIQSEIERFIQIKKNNPLIVIDVNTTIKNALWYNVIEGLPLVEESAQALINKKPSGDIVNRIVNSLSFTKKSKRLRIISAAVVLVTLLLSGFLFYQFNEVQKVRVEILSEQKKLSRANDSLGIVTKNVATAKLQITGLEKEKQTLKKIKTDLDSTVNHLSVLNSQVNKKLTEELVKLDGAKNEFSAIQTATQAMIVAQSDPTKAVTMAMQSYATIKNEYASNLLIGLFNSSNLFYKKTFDNVEELSVSKDGPVLKITLPNRELMLSDQSRSSFKKIGNNNGFIRAFFVCNDSMIFCLSGQSAELYDLTGQRLKQFYVNYNAFTDVCYIRDKGIIAFYGNSKLYILKPGDQEMKEINLDDGNSPKPGYIPKVIYSAFYEQLILVDQTGDLYRFTMEGVFLEKTPLKLEIDRNVEKVSLKQIYAVGNGRHLLLLNNDKVLLHDLVTSLDYFLGKDPSLLSPNFITVSESGNYFAIPYSQEVHVYRFTPASSYDSSFWYQVGQVKLEKSYAQSISFSPVDDYIMIAANTGDLLLNTLSGRGVGVCKVHQVDNLYGAVKNIYWDGQQGAITTGYGNSTAYSWDFSTKRNRLLGDGSMRAPVVLYAASKDYKVLSLLKEIEGHYYLFFRTFDGEISDTLDTGFSDKDATHYYLEFSDDSHYVRLIFKNDSRSDTLFFDAENATQIEQKINFKPITYATNKTWDVKWLGNYFGNGMFHLNDGSGNEVLIQTENNHTRGATRDKVPVAGTIFCTGDKGYEVFFLDINNVTRILKAYNLF